MRVVSDDTNAARGVFTRKVGIVRGGDAADAGQGRQRLEDALVQRIDLIGLVADKARVHAEADKVVGRESQLDGLKITQSSNEEPSANEHEQAQADLSADQNATETQLSAGCRAGLLFQRSHQFRPE